MRREDAPAFRWTSIYGDDPLPSRKEPTFQHGSQSNLYGFAQPALEGDERLYLEAPMRHVTRSLKAHGHGLWTRIPEAQQEQPSSAELVPAQWINADLDSFDYSILGKFDVIVADPPWDIHMSLPYGTMSDDDMRSMPFPLLQDEGYLFLWVTGRAMELGRELLAVWGYTRIDEIVWIKVGQTQRLIRTGRTGHWLNHSKVRTASFYFALPHNRSGTLPCGRQNESRNECTAVCFSSLGVEHNLSCVTCPWHSSRHTAAIVD